MPDPAPIDAHSAVNRLIRTAQHLRIAHERLIDEWSPDAPPLTIVFSNLGRSICRYASILTKTELAELCTVVEDLITRGEENVKNAVATGTLEAMLAESSAGRFDISLVAGLLGPETKAYCRSWDAFTGHDTECL